LPGTNGDAARGNRQRDSEDLDPTAGTEMAMLALSAVIVPGPSQALQPARDSVLAAECRQRQAIGHARLLEQCRPGLAAARWSAPIKFLPGIGQLLRLARNCRHR
jgi:hypothetical protein